MVTPTCTSALLLIPPETAPATARHHTESFAGGCMELENIVVDYETHWGRDYSLKKLSTSEYVRDPRFRVMGLSILRESEQYQPRFLNAFEYRPYLARIDWSRVRMIAHNMHFDGLVHAER